jgi:hypothetical protein
MALKVMEDEDRPMLRVQCLRCLKLFTFNMNDRTLTPAASRAETDDR